jgi:hypothetical protein
MTKRKTKTSVIKAVVDIRSTPPSAYALPEDGRKKRYLCQQRRALANHLATYANPDGTSVRVGATRIGKELGMGRSTVFRLLTDLQRLGFLSNGDIHGQTRTRIRSLSIPKISPVTDSRGHQSRIKGSPVPDSPSPVPDSPTPVPKEYGTLPPSLPPNKPSIQPEEAAKDILSFSDQASVRSRHVRAEVVRLLKAGWTDSEVRAAIANAERDWDASAYTKNRPTLKEFLLDVLEGEVDSVRRYRAKTEERIRRIEANPVKPLVEAQPDEEEEEGLRPEDF